MLDEWVGYKGSYKIYSFFKQVGWLIGLKAFRIVIDSAQ